MAQTITKHRPNPKIKLINIKGVERWWDVKNLVADHWLRPRTPSKKVVWKTKDKSNCSISNLREAHTNRYKSSKLFMKEVIEIKTELARSWGVHGVKAKLAREYDVSLALIVYISKGKKWANVLPVLPPEGSTI